jgi:Domain of unknown function (DUF4440)
LAAPEDAIGARRKLTNRLIADKQADRLRPFFMPNARLITGDGGMIMGVDGIVGAFAAQFAEPGFVPYVRTIQRVDVDARGERAAEHGHWVGAGVSGSYLAVWRKVTGQWVIESELYVTLS